MSPVAIPFEWSIKAPTDATELENGALLIEGWALRYDEVDREEEGWGETSQLMRGIRKFVAGNAPLVHHHDFKTVLGRVVEATPVAGRGIQVKAVVDYQPPSSPWRHLYEAVRRGRLSNLSFGGIFRRENTPDGPRIVDADFLELSVCSTSVGRGTTFEIIKGKALTAPDGKAITSTGDLTDTADLWADIARLERDVAAIRPSLTRAYVVNGHVVEGRR